MTMSIALDETARAEQADEAKRLRRDLEVYRAYLAGPCGHNGPTAPRCPRGPYNGHRHYTAWYEAHRSTVVALNEILAGKFSHTVWKRLARTIDPDEI